jgi:hypothetical protein
MLKEFLADTCSGHDIRGTIFVQCDAMYRAGDDPDLAPLGETEFVNSIAAMSASGGYGSTRVAAGIGGLAELRLGERVDRVLEAHLRAAGDRFKGIRGRSVWDPDKTIKGSLQDFPPGLLLDADFRRGYARLARYRHLDLPSADPGTCQPRRQVFRHSSRARPHRGPARHRGVCRSTQRRVCPLEAQHERARSAAKRQRKARGLAMHLFGFEIDATHRSVPASSEELAALWRPYIETCIELFGADR